MRESTPGSKGQGCGREEAAMTGQMMEPTEALLSLQGVTKAFGGLTAVEEVSFSLRQREILGLIGPNGAAKAPSSD